MIRQFTRRTLLAAAPAAFAATAPTQPVKLGRKVRAGIIGLVGHTGEVITPLPSLPDVEIAAIADPDVKARERLAKNPRVTGARFYDDYHQMLDREQLDVVAVCNDDGGRAAAILACVDHKLHVVAEKPLATTRAGFEKVRQAVASQGVRLSMLLPMRFWPVFVAMKRVVDSGEIGEVAQIASQKSYRSKPWPAWKSKRSTYGSTILWIGPHAVDLIRHVGGREITEAVSYQAHIGAPELGEMENTTATLFRLDNGAIATMRLDFLRPDGAPTHEDDRLRIAGTKGVLEFQASTGLTLLSQQPPKVLTELPTVTPLFVEFLESIYLGKPVTLDLKSIYRVNEIVLSADESARQPRILRA